MRHNLKPKAILGIAAVIIGAFFITYFTSEPGPNRTAIIGVAEFLVSVYLVVNVLFAERIKRWMYPPYIEVNYEPGNTKYTGSLYDHEKQIQWFYHRIRISNTGVGKAEKVHVKIESDDKPGEEYFRDLIPTRLNRCNLENQDDCDIVTGDAMFLDLCQIHNTAQGNWSKLELSINVRPCEPCVWQIPRGYKRNFKLSVTGDNFSKIEYKLSIEYIKEPSDNTGHGSVSIILSRM